MAGQWDLSENGRAQNFFSSQKAQNQADISAAAQVASRPAASVLGRGVSQSPQSRGALGKPLVVRGPSLLCLWHVRTWVRA